MSEVKDYGEPWVVEQGDVDGWSYVDIPALEVRINGSRWSKLADIINISHAARIVACVNAFAGLDPSRSVVVSIEDAQQLLSYLADGGPSCGVDSCSAAIRLRAAIDRVGKEGV